MIWNTVKIPFGYDVSLISVYKDEEGDLYYD